MVPGLENTESDIWDAAQRDSIINSLPREQQIKMIPALCLGSDEGIKELQRFVYNVRKDGRRRDKSLESDFDLGAPHPDFSVRHANDALIPRDSDIAQARSATLRLFRPVWPHLDTIEKPEDKVTNPAAYDDWIRLRDRLKEGRQWLAARDLFGGDGAFLALPLQCVPDRDI